MNIETFIPWLIMSFREWLEAFLIVILIFKFLEKTSNKHLNKSVIWWFFTSVLFSIIFGYLLFLTWVYLERVSEAAKIWESVASLIAVGLVSTFIYWMIKHGDKLKNYVEEKTAANLTKIKIFIVAFILTAREGVEIAIFSFTGKYEVLSIFSGIFIALIVSLIIYHSLAKIKIATLFKITLIYLIIQSGYLLWYSIHEWLSALKSLNYIDWNNVLLIKVFNLSDTIFFHKEWIIWLPLNVLLWWYSKPEWIQFIIQYTYTIILLIYWYKHAKISKKN